MKILVCLVQKMINFRGYLEISYIQGMQAFI